MLHQADFPLFNDNEWLKAVQFAENSAQNQDRLLEVRDKAEEMIKKRTGFSLSQMEELKKAGCTEDDIKKWIDEKRKSVTPPSSVTSNAQRRVAKAEEAAREAPRKEVTRVTRTVSKDSSARRSDRRTYLENKYRNDDGELVCQMCRESLKRCSFLKRNSEAYFWGGEFITSLQTENAANGLLLCPLCGAKYEVLVRIDDGQLSSIREQIAAADPTTVDEKYLVIDVDLNGSPGTIRFVQTHWIDLQAAVEGEDNIEV